ncbi:hypothetical protein M0D73_01435, partial [Shewanella putrefaciens]|uniref:hypothetical protein n=1 Tax=unclassified Shewanella TaxID=196818 RepID=UPI0020050DB7
FLMSFSDYIVAHCEADLKWMGPFHYPCLTASSPSMALVHKLRNPRFLFTESTSECHGKPVLVDTSKR